MYACLVLTAVLSGASIYKRYQVEYLNRSIGLAAEYETVRSLSLAEGMTAEQGLEALKVDGLHYAIVSEDTLGELLSNHEIEYAAPNHLTGPAPELARVQAGLSKRFPKLTSMDATGIKLGEGLNLAGLRGVGVGLDPKAVADAKQAGLWLIARYPNYEGASSASIAQTIAEATAADVKIFLPQGDQVLGRRDLIKSDLIPALLQSGIYYATPEFGKIGGDSEVIESHPEIVVRLHSAQVAELDKLGYSEAVDRYVKAGRERNQRVLMLRPASLAAESPRRAFNEFVRDINRKLSSNGFTMGRAHPFVDSNVPKPLFALIGLSVAPLAWFTFTAFAAALTQRGLSKAVSTGLLVLLVLAGAACYSHSARPIVALLAAITTPTLAFVWLGTKGLKSPILNFIVLCCISWVGGLVAAGLLNELPYFIQAKQFVGIKVAVFLPVLLVGIYLMALFGNFKNAMTSPLNVQQLALAVVVGAALALLIARTGNDSPTAVSGSELKMRAVMDAILFVRPRTKEFMLGHPALIVGLFMLARLLKGNMKPAYAGWTVLALMVGAIGQTGLLNTMCHTHTPIVLSIARNFFGMALGGILGLILWLFVGRWNPTMQGLPDV